MEHVEFIDTYHFEHRYHRQRPGGRLGRFIDFFWEIEFDDLWKDYPEGFSDVLFPNTGYTYLINLGTPFSMQLGDAVFEMKTHGFLPRHIRLACHHSPGNRIFGLKFKVSPVVFQKRVNFSEYRSYIFPLAYLIEQDITEAIVCAKDFAERTSIITSYYQQIVSRSSGSPAYVEMVTDILDACSRQNDFATPIENIARNYGVSVRTLQRYFEAATGLSSKQAIQIMRVRQAVETFIKDPEAFSMEQFGYYDLSHFHKHLRGFLGPDYFALFQSRYRSHSVVDRSSER